MDEGIEYFNISIGVGRMQKLCARFGIEYTLSYPFMLYCPVDSMYETCLVYSGANSVTSVDNYASKAANLLQHSRNTIDETTG